MSSNAARVLEWNGHDLPDGLGSLPPGRYVIEPVESLEDWQLSQEQVQGLEEAIHACDRGEGVPVAVVRERLRERIEEIAARRGEHST